MCSPTRAVALYATSIARRTSDTPATKSFAGCRSSSRSFSASAGSEGSATATSYPKSVRRSGIANHSRAMSSGSAATAASSGTLLRRSTTSRPNWFASADARSRSSRIPESTRYSPRRLPEPFWPASASWSCSSVRTLWSTRTSPRRLPRRRRRRLANGRLLRAGGLLLRVHRDLGAPGGELLLDVLDAHALGERGVLVAELFLFDVVVDLGRVLDRVDVPLELLGGVLAGRLQETHDATPSRAARMGADARSALRIVCNTLVPGLVGSSWRSRCASTRRSGA